jgi:MFS family permease
MKNGTRSVDVAAAIGEAQLGRLQILVLTLCALAAILDGFDLQAIAFTGPVIAQEWGIEATALGVIFSAALAGMTFGALLVGMLGDRFGRKVAVGLSMATFGLFTLAIVRADSYTELLWLTPDADGLFFPGRFLMHRCHLPGRVFCLSPHAGDFSERLSDY